MSRAVIVLSIIVAVLVIVLGFTFFGGKPKKVDGPLTKEARTLIAGQEDRREAEDLLDSEFAQQVPCGAVADHAFVVAGDRAGDPRVWIFMRPDGVVECYDAQIVHPSARKKLKGITTLEVDIIKGDPELYPRARRQAPQPAPVATPAPAATPAPIVVVVPSPTPCAHASGVRILSEGGRCSNH